jgi:hypothetical protein
MAILSDTSRTVELRDEIRSHEVSIRCPKGQAPVVIFQRERNELTPEGEVYRRASAGSVTRTIADAVTAEVVTLASGKLLSAAEVAEAVALFGDKWHAEDLAAASAAAARLAAVKAAKETATDAPEVP